MQGQDPDNLAYVGNVKSPPATQIIANGSVIPYNAGTGTYAVTTSPVQIINLQIVNVIWLRSFAIVPLSSTISVAFFFRYGSNTIGTNPPAVNTTFTIAGVSYTKDFKDGTGRYPQLNAGDALQLIVVASAAGYVTVDIDGEYAFSD